MASGAGTVQALPPTFSIQDPQARAFCEALANAWAVRNDGSGQDGDRFVRKSEIETATADAVVNLLSGASAAASGGGATPQPLPSYTAVIRSVTDLVLNSKAYEWLRNGSRPINAPNSNQGGNILSETQTRSNKDDALAQAVNTIWAAIGSSQALIQDQELAEVSPAAVEATKWDQVQAAVTDPNTGVVSTVSIVESLDAYESKVDGTMNATWGVHSNVNGVVTGIVLMTTAGAGSPPGTATSDFMVMANRFSLVSPTNGSLTPVPFSVDDTGTAIFTGTVFAAAGVFGGSLSAATGTFSGDLSAAGGTFSGALSAATGTFSGSFTAAAVNAVNTINLAGQSVTVPAAAYTAGSIIATMPSPGGGAVTTDVQTVSLDPASGKVTVIGGLSLSVDGTLGEGSGTFSIALFRDGGQIFQSLAIPVGASSSWTGIISTPPILDDPGTGSHTYTLSVILAGDLSSVTPSARGLLALGTKR